jgi:hypothetical protein
MKNRGRSLQPAWVTANLAGFRRRAVDRSDLKQASVALCIQTAADGDTLLITRRAPGLRDHAGQWALPLADLDVEPQFLRIPQAPGPVIKLPLFDRHVHAPTAAIIYQFCQVAMHGNALRVAHFEAPVHLWR